jgi:hypothetical protein
VEDAHWLGGLCAGAAKEASRPFLKKGPKNFYLLALFNLPVRLSPKVFWFFFSKKNALTRTK